jgi:hypothetical protein
LGEHRYRIRKPFKWFSRVGEAEGPQAKAWGE